MMAVVSRVGIVSCAAAVMGWSVLVTGASAATLAATYQFDNTLAADEAGPPSLVAVDPLGQGAFVTDTVFGVSRTVYAYGGNAEIAAEQGGLTLDTSSLVTANDYSVEMVFKFTERDSTYRRIYQAMDRNEDDGFYVSGVNRLNLYLGASNDGPNAYVNGEYHHVVMTVSGNTASAYLDGQLQLSLNTSVMNIASDTLYFFLDNLSDGALNEYASGRVAMIRLYDGALSSGQVASLAGQVMVPEPASIALIGVGAWLTGFRRR